MVVGVVGARPGQAGTTGRGGSVVVSSASAVGVSAATVTAVVVARARARAAVMARRRHRGSGSSQNRERDATNEENSPEGVLLSGKRRRVRLRAVAQRDGQVMTDKGTERANSTHQQGRSLSGKCRRMAAGTEITARARMWAKQERGRGYGRGSGGSDCR
jgi:hypothetical protein